MSKSTHILLAGSKDLFFEKILHVLETRKNVSCTHIENGQACLEHLKKHTPDLIIMELMLPGLHGMKLLNYLKQSNACTKTIICSLTVSEQDYYEAIEKGTNFFLAKPFTEEVFENLLTEFEKGSLKPLSYKDTLSLSIPSAETTSPSLKKEEKILPKRTAVDSPKYGSYLKFWGTRGSIPVSGYEHLLYGGNTSCLELCHEDTLIIVDAGTGIRAFGKVIKQLSSIRHIHLIISHTHWDHILGFPFFLPLYDPSYTITIYAPISTNKSIKEVLTGMLAREYFPVSLDEMAAKLEFVDLDFTSSLDFGSLKVHYRYANHPGPCACFRFETPHYRIGYATDNEAFSGYMGPPQDISKKHPLFQAYAPFVDFFSDCQYLIHEAQYTNEEYVRRAGWGHSSMNNASLLMKFCKPEKWYVTHHDPEATDEKLMNRLIAHKEILRSCEIESEVHLAYDYLDIPLIS